MLKKKFYFDGHKNIWVPVGSGSVIRMQDPRIRICKKYIRILTVLFFYRFLSVTPFRKHSCSAVQRQAVILTA
jgi:hypothetical protein